MAVLDWIQSHNSVGWMVFYLLATVFVVFALIWLLRGCMEYVKITGRSSLSVIKVIIVGIAPSIFCVMAMLEKEPPVALLLPVGIIACVGVTVWNIVSFGPIIGTMFSILHIVGGLLAGLGVASMVFVVIALVVAFFFGGSLSSGSSSGSGGKPSRVVDVKTGQGYYVDTDASGALRLPEKGHAILRPSGYSGRYIDDYGNEYMAS